MNNLSQYNYDWWISLSVLCLIACLVGLAHEPDNKLSYVILGLLIYNLIVCIYTGIKTFN